MPLDPGDVAVIVDALYARIYGTFGPLHGDLAHNVKYLVGEVIRLSDRVDTIERQLEAVERKTGLMGYAKEAYADLIGGQKQSIPAPGMECPIEIDRACVAAGTAEAKPAVIPELGNLVMYPKQGHSPTQVWYDTVQSITAVRAAETRRGGVSGATGLPRSRRTKQR